MEWSNTQVLKLINLYQEHECLWNPKHDKHKSKTAKIDAWNQISEQIGSDTVEIKKKIDSLLGSFRRERQKHDSTSKTGTGTSDVYKSTWFAFKSMYFLIDKFKVRKTTNTEPLLEEPDESEIGEAIDDNPENTEDDDDATLDRDNGSNQNNKNETVSTPKTSPKTEKRKSMFQSPKAKRIPNNKQKSRSDEAYSILKQTVENRNHRDESVIFGEHVANKHRKYNQHTRSVVEHLLADILFKVDMGDYEKNAQNRSSSNFTLYTTPIPSPSPTFSSSEYSQSVSNKSHVSSSFTQNNTFSNTDSYPSCSTFQPNGDRLVSYINTFIHEDA